jgi:DNA-binding NtrC family response regulator
VPSAESSKAPAVDELPFARAIDAALDGVAARKSTQWISLEQMEREHIVRTLEHTFNNRSAAARLLGVTRQALLRKMKRHGLTGFDNPPR